MPEQKKRRPVDHKHPAIAAAIHVLQACGGGPLSAKVIFDRAFDRGLLAATAYNTLRGRLSQHQAVERVVVLKTPEGYMLAPEGVPEDLPERAVAPSRPPLPEPLREDPLAVVPTPRPSRRRRPEPEPEIVRVRDIVVTADWLRRRDASAEVVKWVRLARWRSQWDSRQDPTVRDLLTGWLPPSVAAWLVDALPLERTLKRRLKRASGQAERRRIIEGAEKPSRRSASSTDTSAEEDDDDEGRDTNRQREPNGEPAGAGR